MHSKMLALSLAAGLTACGGSGSGDTGTMRLSLTDAPACGYDAINITVEKVRVHKSGNAGDNDSGWSEVVLGAPRRIDLLSLTNGVLEELGQTQLPAGTYTQMRLVLSADDGSGDLENSVVPSGGTETALDTPSGQQSGLKMNVNLTVEPDKIADFVIDIDACKSIHVAPRGNTNRYNLRPVVRVMPVLSDAGQRIVGYVDPSIAVGSTRISVQQNGDEVKATPPITSGADLGKFVLYPVPPGDYTLVVTADGRASAVLTGVPVTTTAFTFANAASAPIAPPISAMRSASGAVTVGGSTADTEAEVAASQTLDTLPIEVASQSVDAVSGAYAFSLPASAPQRAAYAASGVPSFGPVNAAAGAYMLTATIPSVAPKTALIDVDGAVPVVTPFAFP